MASGSNVFDWHGTAVPDTLANSASWFQDAVPGSTDVAVFGSRAAGSDIVHGVARIGQLDVTSDRFSVKQPPTFFFTGTITALGIGSASSVEISGQATAELYRNATLSANDISIPNGTLIARGDGSLTQVIAATSVELGRAGYLGDLSIGRDAVLDDTGTLGVGAGAHASGAFELAGSAFVGNPAHPADMSVGTGVGSTGDVEVGALADLRVGGTLATGGAGNAQFSIGANAQVSAGVSVILGRGTDVFMTQGSLSAPSIDIRAGATVLASGALGSYLTSPISSITNAGIIQASGSLAIAGTITSEGGTLAVGTRSSILAEAVNGRATLAFLGPRGLIDLQSVSDGTRVTGFQPGDLIALSNAASLTFDDTTGVATISLSTGGSEHLHFLGLAGETVALQGGDIVAVRSGSATHDLAHGHPIPLGAHLSID